MICFNFAIILAGLASLSDARKFSVAFRRYSEDRCLDVFLMDRKNHLLHGQGAEVKDGHCHSWPKNHEFGAYSFNFMHHAFTTRPKNKKCDLTVFSEHGCHGDVVSVTEDIADGEKDGCHDTREMTGMGRSVKVKCE